MNVSTFLLILASIFLGIAGQISLKYGIKLKEISLQDFLSKKFFSIILDKFILLGLTFYLFATFLWLIVLSKEEVSKAYPMLAIGYIIIVIISKIFLHESLTILKVIGIILISLGVFFLFKS